MYEQGLGVLPIIVTTAVNLLVPAIQSLFQSNSQYSFPAAKKMIDDWAGVVNLDPTLRTANAQWAWANVRCLAGDPTASADVATALQLFPRVQLGPFPVRMTPDGPVPDGMVNPCTATEPSAVAYALAAVRVLTAAKAQNPPSDTLYGDTLPVPLPKIVPQSSPSNTPLGGIPVTYLIAGAVAIFLIARRR